MGTKKNDAILDRIVKVDKIAYNSFHNTFTRYFPKELQIEVAWVMDVLLSLDDETGEPIQDFWEAIEQHVERKRAERIMWVLDFIGYVEIKGDTIYTGRDMILAIEKLDPDDLVRKIEAFNKSKTRSAC